MKRGVACTLLACTLLTGLLPAGMCTTGFVRPLDECCQPAPRVTTPAAEPTCRCCKAAALLAAGADLRSFLDCLFGHRDCCPFTPQDLAFTSAQHAAPPAELWALPTALPLTPLSLCPEGPAFSSALHSRAAGPPGLSAAPPLYLTHRTLLV